jgi:hypothetical protein
MKGGCCAPYQSVSPARKADIAQERKRAKDLLKALRTSDGEAIARFRSHHPCFADLD